MSYLAQRLSITVGWPWALALIPVLLPALVWFSYRSLAGLGPVRRLLAIGLRSVILLLILLAIAQVQSVRRNDRLSTIFLLDLSQSIPREWQRLMIDFVNKQVDRKGTNDLAGVVTFGKSARVEVPPTPFFSPFMGFENPIDAEYTDLAAAIKLAMASFPEDTARRIVLISDGNENRGHAIEQALAAASLKVPIDVVPIEYTYSHEVLVEKVSLPPDVKKGETVNINVVIRASEPTSGSLQIFQQADNYRAPAPGNEQPQHIELQRGVNVFTLKQQINEPNFYTYTATFVPDEGSGDQRAINNTAHGFTLARGDAHVLLIEGTKGEHDELVQALREKKLLVTVLEAGEVAEGGIAGGDPIPTDVAGLQPYDAVILANVPKDAFTEDQIRLLESNVHDMGAGLVMIGGPKSFGAGGWRGTPVEKALPVNMEIPSTKVMGKAAMVLIMHASEIPEGNYWQKVVAQEAIKTLSPYDYAGMLHWEGQEAWLFSLRPIGTSMPGMLRAIDKMTPGDMPDFDPSLMMAMKGLNAIPDATTKHIVVISDGDPTPPKSSVIQQLARSKITVTAVLTAAHGNDLGALNSMKNLANKTQGRFYNVVNPKALPRIYQKEARLVSKPLIFEGPPRPWVPSIDHLSEPVLGLPDALPPIYGMVLTAPKENELVEIPLRSPQPTGQVNPLLAHWTYGLGRAVAFTSDAGARWTPDWEQWEHYAAFWSQVVRWSLRPIDKGNLTLTARQEEGRIKIVVDALDKDNQFLNFLQIRGNLIGPDFKPRPIELTQTAPGKYEATLENAESSGNYFVNLAYMGPDNTSGVVRTGVSVPYSDEYRDLRSNRSNLETLASVSDGEVIEWKTGRDNEVDVPRTVQAVDVFRRSPGMVPPRSYRDLWPNLLMLAAMLFLLDVGVRRVAPDFDRMRNTAKDYWAKLRGREVAPRVEYMEKLKSRKAEVAEQIDRNVGATRFEAPPLPAAGTVIGEPLLEGGEDRPRPAERRPAQPAQPGLAPDQPRPGDQPESYTNRLLRAKQKVWEEREKEKEKDKDKPN
ncbi:MAG: glutamine amidotransferase [Isosphaeraceae bacterium]